MRSYKFNITKLLVSGLLCIGLMQPVSAATLSIPDSPLTVTTFTVPNIMFILDDSGSMNNIIWDTAYLPTTAYTDWSSTWSPTNGNVFLSALSKGSCGAGFLEGKNGGNNRCLKLPDPLGGGNTRYHGNYLNYLFETYGVNATDKDLTAIIPTDFRMNVARNVSANVINSSTNMKFCLQTFNFQQAGSIDVACTTTKATVTTAIAALTANSWTPLAESYYEVTRYFRGLDTYTSPITERCQKNYAIVVTDGYPTFDNNFPNNDPDDPGSILPNWDGLAPNTTIADFNASTIPQYSDGFSNNGGSQGNEGFTLFLDDIAKFGFDIDLRKAPDLDSSGMSFDAADYPKQNLVTFTVGFALNNQMLQDAATYGDGQYFQANDAAGLMTALTGALTDIQGRTSASAAVAASSGFISSDTGIYFGRYNSGTATGQLLYYKLDPLTGQLITTGPGPAGSLWDAGALIPSADTRNIHSFNGQNAVSFKWAATTSATTLTTAQQTAIGSEKVLEYIRGDQNCEVLSAGTCASGTKDLRDRISRLGTIVNSQPLFVGAPGNLYPDSWGDGSTSIPENCVGCEYSTFVNNPTNKNRNPMVYFGANDGMLHAVDAATGIEKFAYIPSSVISNLKDLSSTTYTHKFFVDGSANVIDAFIGGNTGSWFSILIGSLNKGGQGVFALDVTNPANFADPTKVAYWEFTDSADADLGFTYARPAIIRMHNNRWAAVFGNGYNNSIAENISDTDISATGHASIFVVFLEGPSGANGAWNTADFVKFDTLIGTVATPNGIGSVTPIDIDGDKIADYIYGGDLEGNMWKIDITNSNPAQWDFANKQGNTPKAFFIAQDELGNTQAITSRPIVSNSGVGGYHLFFGTGRYLDTSDASAPNATIKEHFYGVLDPDDGTTYSTLAGFTKQGVVQQKTITLNDGTSSETNTVRIVSTLGNDKPQNWFFVLSDQGERQVSTAVKRGKNIIFVTNVPSAATCDFGGYSWLMELDSRDGSVPADSFDLTGDGKVNGFDKNNGTTLGGVRSDGKLSAPTILAGAQTDKKIMTTSAGNVKVITEKSPAGANRRHSWRQLR